MKLNLSELDNMINQALGNMKSQSDNSQNQSNQEIQGFGSMTEPMIQFLDSEEEQERSKINDFKKTTSVISDPDEKKVKNNAIKKSQNKLSQINKAKDNILKKQEELKKQLLQKQNSIELQNQQMKKTTDMLNQLKNQIQEVYNKYYSAPILQRFFPNQSNIEMQEQNNTPVQNQSQQSIQTKPQSFKVKFEGSTPNPFEVLFSERGFKIGETRLSFETIEEAISKNFTITLDNGSGLVLDAVRMQKILKYKNRI